MFRSAPFRLLAVSFLLFEATNVVTKRVLAADRFWITTTGGSFNSTTHWSATDGGLGGASVPAAADIANFTLSNTYEVEFPVAGSLFNTDLDLENGNVTFDLNGSTYTLTGTLPIVVGGIASQTGRLTVTEGILAVETLHDNVQVGTSDNATGFLTIAGDGQLGTAAVRPLMVIGQNGAGTLTVQNNGLAFSSDFLLGTNVGSTGAVTLTGQQATIDISGSAQIGDEGTGTMTVSAGALLDGALTTIGSNAGSNGTVTITGAGSRWIQSSSMTVGSSGVGTLNVQSGGELSTSAFTIGSATSSFGTATISGGGTASTNTVIVGSSGTGTLTVTGAGSSLDTNGLSLTVGSGSTAAGDVTVSAGGAIETSSTTLGSSAGSNGSLSLSGSTSSFTSASGNFTVGNSGTGTLEVTGGVLNSITSRIASSLTSTGSALVSGAGSTWNASSLAIGGALLVNGGAGTLAIEAGGTVNVAGATEVRSSAGSALTIDGGTLTTNDFTRLGTFNFLDGTLHVKGVYDNGAAPAALVIDGTTAADLPTMRLSGNAGVSDVTSITVGGANQGALVIDSDRTINTGASNIAIGADPLSNGTLTVTDASLETTGTLSVGGDAATEGGMGVVNINTGGLVEATTLRLFEQGTININGGTLQFSAFPTTSGKVNFNSGLALFEISINLTNSLLDTLLGPVHTLGPGQTMTGAIQVTVQSPLNITGGTFSSASNNINNDSALQISEGVVSAAATFINNTGRLVVISGTGRLSASGITNNGTIQLDDNLVPTSGGGLTNNGTIRGSGFIGNVLTNNAAGQVQVTTGQRLQFQGGSNTNSGSLSFVGGEMVFTGTLTNSAGTGLISGHDAILRANAGITNDGSIAFTAGTMDVFGDITSTRFVSASDRSRITVSGGGIATFYDDVAVSAGQTDIQVSAAAGIVSRVVFFGSYNGGSTGTGVVFIEGDHRPGNSPAAVNFGGDLSYGALSMLKIELAGTLPGSQFDQVHVTGDLVLDGTLAVSLINGFSPAAGNSFDILDWGTLSGAFATVQLPALGANLMWNASQLYTTGVLRVGLTGDYNLNGIVDGADYVVWRNSQGQTGVGLAADGDSDGQITVADYGVWRSRFGQAVPGGGAGATDAVVPEPAGLVLLVAGGLLACVCGRRQRCGRESY